MKLHRLGVIALLVVCLPRHSSAARPFATEDAGTAGEHITELEAAVDMTHASACSGLALNRGIAPWLDLGIAFCYSHQAGRSTYDGTEAAFKLALWPERLALAGTAALGAASRSVDLALSQSMGAVQADLSLGAGLELGGAPHPEWGVAMSTQRGDVGLGMEVRGVKDGAATWMLGWSAPFGALAVDVGVGGAFHKGRDFTLAAGITLPLGGN